MKGESGASDDELNSDVVSHYSSASESASVVEEGTGLSAKSHSLNVCCASTVVCLFTSCRTGGEQVDEQTAQEETEDKLKQCIDNLMDKRYVYFKVCAN